MILVICWFINLIEQVLFHDSAAETFLAAVLEEPWRKGQSIDVSYYDTTDAHKEKQKNTYGQIVDRYCRQSS